MIPKAEFFEWIENYCHEQLNEIEKLEFDSELEHNSELREELNLHQEIQSAIAEKDVTNLREKLQSISKQKIDGKENGTFDLLDDFANIEEINENVSPEELINYYDSLPKVHVYQHELVSNENIHEFYKEQSKSKNKGEKDDSLNGFDFEEFDEFEGIGDALLEKDILDLRETLSQVAKSVKPQFSTKDIDKYIAGELTGIQLEQFENEIEQSKALKEEVELHKQMESAVIEDDVLKLRNQLTHIVNTETSWNVSEKSIENYIDGELEGELLEEFLVELNENTDLMAEVSMRQNVNEALGEQDVFKLRKELKSARENAENTEIKSIVPASSSKLLRTWKQYAAVMILLVGITGFFNIGFKSLDNTYNSHYNAPEWSPERSVTSDFNYLNEANILYMNGNYEKAIELYNIALKEENEKYAFHFYKGASLQNMDKLKEAIPEYNQVINHGNNLFIEEAEWNKSLCYVKLGNKEKAKEQLSAIINRNGYYKNDAKAVLRRLKFSIK